MALLNALVTVILPVVLVVGVGALLGRRFPLDQDTLGKITLHGLTPAIALHVLLTTRVAAGVGVRIVVAYVVATVGASVVGLVASPGLRARSRRAVMVAAGTANSGNMGLPIALFALGQPGLEQTVLMFIVSIVAMFLLVPLILGSHSGPVAALVGLGRLPMTWAVLVAAALRLTGLMPPVGVMRGIELLADACLPMALLSLGIQLASSGRVRLTRAVLTGTTLRVLVMPVLAVGIGLLCGLHGTPLQALVLAQAMPVAVLAYMLTREYDGDVETIAHSVTLSTAISFVTIAGVTALLPALGRL